MNKKKLAEMFGIDTHEEDIRRMNMENESLASQVAKLKIRCEQLGEELSFYKASDEDKVKALLENMDGLEATYKERIREYEEAVAECEKIVDSVDQVYHRGFARGREAVYSELGIWNIEAHERGNNLAILEDGEVVEVICDDLVDVKPSEDISSLEEIKIDDLIGGVE